MTSRHLALLAALAVASLPDPAAFAGYAQPGHGLQNVASGTLANGALYWQTEPTWVNLASPEKPYQVIAPFTLPPCLDIPVARLAMTVWGGTANYVCHMGVTINGTSLTGMDPLVFGTTADATPVFQAASPCAYGSGSGVWLVTLPVAGTLLRTDGGSNEVAVTINTPDSFDSFDGRIQHLTLLAIYQSALLANSLDYSFIEGSGDIYRTPGAGQSNQRTVAFRTVTPAGATAARLTALYTYGDTGQNDRLLFNGIQLGGNDVAGWDKTGSGRDFGPSVVGFDVTPHLAADNGVRFTVASGETPDTRESSLRPQLAALAVTRATATAGPPVLYAGRTVAGLNLTLFASPGQTCRVMESADLVGWDQMESVLSSGAPVTIPVSFEPESRFFRVESP